MAKRIRDLTVQATKAFDQVIEIDKTGLTETKQLTVETLQRTKVPTNQDGTGGGSKVVTFEFNDYINLTINANTTAQLSTIKDRETVYLKVNKGSSDILSFQTFPGLFLEEAQQVGLTQLFFEITRMNDASDTSTTPTIIKQLNSQASGTLTTGDFSLLGGTITSVDHFRWSTNKNICTFNGEFDITATSNLTELNISIIGDWSVNPVDSQNPIDTYLLSGDVPTIYGTQSRTTTSSVLIKLSETLSNTESVTVQWSGSFIIE